MKKLFVCVATLLVACSLSATVHKVKASDGAEVLKSTIAEAAAGDTVLVQEGTFTGNFTMKEGVQVIGGWNGLFSTQKDYATILDANADGRVLNQPAAFSTLTVWSNFTIQNGKLTTALSDQGAAGVFLNKNGRVQECLIQNNVVDVASGNAMGGGVSCNSGNADPDTVAYSCVIKNNSATHGGGVRVNGKGVVVYNCVIEDNQTTNNAAGGVHLHNGSKLINCIVRNNKANGDTGGVRLTGGNVSDIINCLIAGNEATATVGGICMEGNLANIINNTIVGNKQGKSGATASLSGVKVKNDANANGTLFVNNIVWGNITGDTIAPQGVYYISRYDKSKGQRSYNAIIGQAGDDDKTGTTSLNLTKENPGFFDPESGDFTLVDGSKLIDFGSNAANTLPIDLVGSTRIQGKAIDLGCYEAASKYVLVGQDLQKALDITAKGDTLLVQAGTFVGNFVMRNGVNVSGGWNEDFTEQTPYGTILDGDAKGRVLTQKEDFDVLTVWDNVTIQNGNVGGDGGGVYMLWKSLLKHCLIQNNIATGEGGGVKHNKDDYSSDIVLEDCIITGNTAKQGGGLWIRSTALNCVIDGNQTTTGPGGGVVLSWARLYNCQVTNNIAGEDAGGVRMYGGGCIMVNCLVAKNYAKGHDDYKGKVGGVCIEKNLGAVINCTIVDNDQLLDTTDKEYCGVRVDANSGGDDKIFTNNIIYGNKAGGVVQDQQISYNICKYKYSSNNAIYGAVTGDYKSAYINLKEVDPKFNEDYTLSPASELINAGADVTGSSFYQATDLAGNDRIQGLIIDLGAYEAEVIKLTVAAYENAVATMNDDTIAAGDYYVAKGKEVIFAVTADEGYYIEVAKLNNDTIGENCEAFTAPATLTEDAILTIVTKKQSGTALINAKANKDATKAKKVMVNGKLFVIKDNARYNVLGVKL